MTRRQKVNGYAWVKQILEAYETLLDPERRRRYDSTLEFNDAIPEKFDPTKDDFFEIFGQVFRRNAYFSKKSSVPDLGKQDEDIKRVLAFYKFWDNFDSWREFVHEDEYDLSQAESRYERRYMERENRRLKANMYKNEKIRLNRLVNLAYSNDPRIKAMIDRQEEERLARKREKQAVKEKKKAEEQARLDRIREEQRRVEEEEKAKEIREKEQIANKKNQRRANERQFRSIFKEKVDDPKYDDYYIDELLFKMHDEDFLPIFAYMTSLINISPLALEKHIQEIKSKRVNQVAPVIPIEKPQEEKELEWTAQEISLLTKGIIKFPAGTQDRWNRVALYIGGRFTETQVLTKAKMLKSKHKNELPVKISNYVNPKLDNGATNVPKPVSQSEAQIKEVKPTNEAEENGALVWSQEQQSQLEKAIKKFPATIPAKERWEKIASEVDGKTMKECVERFKWIKEKLKPKD